MGGEGSKIDTRQLLEVVVRYMRISITSLWISGASKRFKWAEQKGQSWEVGIYSTLYLPSLRWKCLFCNKHVTVQSIKYKTYVGMFSRGFSMEGAKPHSGPQCMILSTLPSSIHYGSASRLFQVDGVDPGCIHRIWQTERELGELVNDEAVRCVSGLLKVGQTTCMYFITACLKPMLDCQHHKASVFYIPL